MARGGSGGIKGITIEIDGNTGPLEEAMKDVNKQARALQNELTQIDRGLRFNPGNTELIAQQQEVLAQRVQVTSQRLDQLRAAQAQVDAQFARGDISAEQYRAFNREVSNTQGQLDGLQRRMRATQEEQDRLARSQQDLRNFFDATRTSVDNYADVLGTDLTRAIREGRASSAQLEDALDRIGRSALGGEADLDRMRRTLRNLDSGGSLDDVREDLDRIEREARQAEDAVEDLEDDLKGAGSELSSLIGGLAAGGGIAGAIAASLNNEDLRTQIDISFNVPKSSKESVRQAIVGLNKYGVEGEEALEGVRRQWALNKNASDAANTAFVKGAAVIAKAYAGIDFTELVQETNEFAVAIGVTNEEALALTNALLKFGFPPEQLDILSEYGLQMKDIGFNTAEIQAIFEKGVDLKSWNLDK